MSPERAQQRPAFTGLMRRLMVVSYDLFLLIAILFIATAVFNALNHGKAIDPSNPYYFFYVFCLLAISFFYYGWFWTRGGQTLGMKTWKIKLQSCNQTHNVSWQQVSIRAFVALVSAGIFGLGFAWSLIDKKKRTWHDIASKTEIIDQS
jgi:uncharacterized RDD family membrane protein YckC